MSDHFERIRNRSSLLDIHNNTLLKLSVHREMRVMILTNLQHTPLTKVMDTNGQKLWINQLIEILKHYHHHTHNQIHYCINIAIRNSFYTNIYFEFQFLKQSHIPNHFPYPLLMSKSAKVRKLRKLGHGSREMSEPSLWLHTYLHIPGIHKNTFQFFFLCIEQH